MINNSSFNSGNFHDKVKNYSDILNSKKIFNAIEETIRSVKNIKDKNEIGNKLLTHMYLFMSSKIYECVLSIADYYASKIIIVINTDKVYDNYVNMIKDKIDKFINEKFKFKWVKNNVNYDSIDIDTGNIIKKK